MASHHDVPLPRKKLGQHCSALVNGTLYTFSETAFQSIRLEKGAEWEDLPLNFGTRGAVCVHANEGTPEEALFVVGGVSRNTTMTPENGYMGMQKYTLASRKWEIVRIADPIAFNLTNHGATFLKATNEIMMFGGARWPAEDTPSAMAFLIKTVAPYQITAITTEKAPPLLAPMVLPWGDDAGLIVGGGVQNTGLYTFSPSRGWTDLGVQLPQGLPLRQSGATLVDGDDGCRMLLTFDITTQPVKFQRIKVKEASQDNRRLPSPDTNPGIGNLTEENWPTYDGNFAPENVNVEFSFAQNGPMLLFSGGNENAPICIFNTRENHWNDPTLLFQDDGGSNPGERRPGQDDNQEDIPNTGETPLPPSGSGGGGGGGDGGGDGGKGGLNNVQKIFIGIGAVIAGVLLIVFLIFGERKLRKQRGRSPRNLSRSGTGRSKMSFQDRGLGFMRETRNSNAGEQSDKNFVDDVPPQTKQRGSGWSRYFSGNSATNLVNLPSRTYSTGTVGSSVYGTNSTRFPYSSGISEVEGANGGQGPQVSPFNDPGTNRSQGLILDLPGPALNVSAASFKSSRRSSVSSIGGANSFYSSGVPESIAERSIWSPVGGATSTGFVTSSGPVQREGYAGVRDSPRGWGVLTLESRGSSVYPESAVTVYPEDWAGAGEPGVPSNHRPSSRKRDENLPPLPVEASRAQEDVSWLNLNHK